jgi:hypothetical protein
VTAVNATVELNAAVHTHTLQVLREYIVLSSSSHCITYTYQVATGDVAHSMLM